MSVRTGLNRHRVASSAPAHRTRGVRLASATLLGSLTMVGGCMVGPNFEPLAPRASVNEAWIDSGDASVSGERLGYDDWWSVFEDPVLDDLVSTAYEQNLSLRVAGLRVLEARARRGIAAGLFFPQLQNMSAFAGAVSLSENDANAVPLDRDFSDYSVGVDAVWELDFWGKFRRGVESADAALLASVYDYDSVLVSLIGEVAATYVLIRTFEERLVLARENEALQTRTLEIATVRFDNGATSELDVTQARSNLASTRALIPLLEDGLRKSKVALSVLLGLPPSELTALLGGPGAIPVAPADVALGVPADLLRRRPDVRRAEQIAAALSAQIGVAEANKYPSVRVLGSTGLRTSDSIGVGGSQKDLGDLLDSDSVFGFIGIDFVWPILQYGRLTNRVRERDAQYQQAVLGYEETVLRAAGEVESGLSSYLNFKRRADHLETGARAAERSVELALEQYRAGTIDFNRVINTQTSLVLQQDRLAEARSGISLGLIATYKALGGGWELRVGKEFIPPELQQEMRERTDWGSIMDSDYSSGRDLIFERPDPDAHTPAREPEAVQIQDEQQ